MRVAKTVAELRVALSGRRDRAVGFVPTMGNLHAGHLRLVQLARSHVMDGLVVVSIFVNPLQFAPHEDFGSYPRTLEEDLALLSGAGCDVVFAPCVAEIYAGRGAGLIGQACRVYPPAALADVLEGEFRPGFLVGVATVVVKLFGMVQPDVAVFGLKDYQQQLVIKNVVRELALDVKVVTGEIVREEDGLALSSRNRYLDAKERVEARELSVVLRGVAMLVKAAGAADWRELEQEAMAALRSRGWEVDYVAIRSGADLSEPCGGEELVVLGAARIGKTRLIDNVEVARAGAA